MTTKEEAKKEVKKLVDEFKSIPEQELNSMPEEQIKYRFIEPLFDALGWQRKDIEKETRVLKGRADYILKLGNQEVLVVEAKKTSVRLSEEEGRQAVSYAYHRKIKFSVLTNFKHLYVYHALSNIKNIDNNLLKKDGNYFRLGFEEFEDKFEFLWLLSRESFEKQEINKLLSSKDEKINKPVDERILADLLQIREWLTKELKSKKNYLEKENIDEIVQILIDRLIFIRSIEDRKIEAENFLLGMSKQVIKQEVKLQFFPYLLQKFEYFNKKYDSKLFEQGILEKEGTFSDDVLHKVIKTLYFGLENNQTKYMFDEIPGDLFGSIYEQYLGVITQSTEKRVKLEEESGKRKKMGIYYTPSYIVDYIVKNTVGEYIRDKTIDEILKVKILDPACGSGSFLIGAFQEVCNMIEEKLKNEQFGKAPFTSYVERLSLAQKIAILINCIHGVDLDEKAVELTRLNLLLNLLDGENKDTNTLLLPHLENNIKCGNSLIDDPKFSENAFKWQVEFKDILNSGGFDVVVGNPPYVRQEKLKEIKGYLEKTYKTYVGTADLFVYFFERSIVNLKSHGKFGFIVSNKFARSGYGERLRNFILTNTSIKQYIDKFDDKVFAEATVDPCIIILEKSKIAENQIIYNYSTKVNQNNLGAGSWSFGGEDSQVLKRKIEGVGKKIKDFDDVNIYFGLKSGLNEAFIVTKEQKEKFDKKSQEIIKPLLRGRDISRYNIEFSNLYIILMKIGYKIEDFPSVKKHLESFKNALLKRTDYKPKIMQWYNLRPCDYYGEFEKEKIMYPDISQDSGFCWDSLGYFLNDSGHILVGGNKYWLAILNSKVIRFYLKQITYSLGETGTRLKQIFINEIPIKLPIQIQEKQIINLVNQMLELQKKYHDPKVIGNEKERLKKQIDAIDYEIDQEIYKLYGISEEEIKIVEESVK